MEEAAPLPKLIFGKETQFFRSSDVFHANNGIELSITKPMGRDLSLFSGGISYSRYFILAGEYVLQSFGY